MNKTEFKKLVTAFDYKMLFIEELGWNNDKTVQSIAIENEAFPIKGIAEKCGLKILTLEVDNFPSAEMRKKIDIQVRKLFHYYILIIHNTQNRQVWLVPVKKNDKRELVFVEFFNTQDAELLFQKVTQLSYSLDEEEKLTIVDVSKRVNDVFTVNSDRITADFYKQFSAQHKAFRQFIEGVEETVNKDWYASLMLNRLMFCYFIQKKRFLDNNVNYLREKLNHFKEQQAKGEFYSFYRSFLLTLFHEGLGSPDNMQHKDLIGKVPYLNGGLFDTHDIETSYKDKINIKDEAFEKIFDFFDQYEWHLDTRITATGKDINPDVIGYIFEKYINDRAQMGAYYTKEDITEYISKNCILPYLFDEAKRNHEKAFNAKSELWNSVAKSGDRYIYDAVKKGTEYELPDEIAQGIDDVGKRTEWNKTATAEFALPTEIWRETIERRKRCADIKNRIKSGEIQTINDFITYNLNIRLFAQDVLENTTDAELLKHFYKALNSVTIIDPTCGSGAFLFAAMNILEPLYETCILRMEEFTTSAKGKHKFFEETLAQIKSPEHPNLQYFIYKSIILRNLYGVDIMKEATEIAKLRLFLKLVATVEANYRIPNLGLEPLPDVDFNIRAGNTLIGFATEAELQKGLRYTLDGVAAQPVIEEKCEIVARAFTRYKEIQLVQGDDYRNFKIAKEELNTRLKELNQELNLLLHKQATAYKYEDWLQTHQPFHWFAEFYEIIQGRGGFDVIIGNPPYVALKDIGYKPKNYNTLDCGDIYALCIERAIGALLNKDGRIGMIVPISIASTDGYSSLRKVCFKSKLGFYFSNFGVRPSKLFDGVDKRLTVFISNGKNSNQSYSTKYHRWVSLERDILFQNLSYKDVQPNLFSIDGLPKISSTIEQRILKSLGRKKKAISNYIIRTSSHKVKYTRKLQYFIQFFESPPVIYDNTGKAIAPSELKEIDFNNKEHKEVTLAALNSSLFFWFFITFSDCRNVNSREILKFPIELDSFQSSLIKSLSKLGKRLMDDFKNNSILQRRNDKRAGEIEIESFQPRLSKPIIDEIDRALAEHYGFSDEELDFIINYDIKYRMGKELEED